MKPKKSALFHKVAILLCVGVSWSANADAYTFKLAENPEHSYTFNMISHDYERFVEAIDGQDPFDLENWKNMDLDRHSLEALIFSVAPIFGECNCQVVVEPYSIDTPHGRTILQVEEGSELSHPVAVFSGDSRVNDGLYLSRSVLAPEDFFVGLYTHEGREDVLSLTSEEEILNLTFIAGHDWEIDNQVLDDLGVRHVKADNWNTAIDQIIVGRADVIMQPFHQSEDLGFIEETTGEKFVPIPNFRLPFPQGRVYFVSEKHPRGSEFLENLNGGIRALDGDEQFLREAHIWAGVINPATDGFQTIRVD